MSQFLTSLRIEQIGWRDGRPLWEVLSPLRYRSAVAGGVIVIPAGFKTDLASVPRFVLTWLLAGGKAPRPAVLHDYPYQYGIWQMDDREIGVDKALADAVFHEAMAADPWSGTNPVTRWLMWATVRMGGRGVWADEVRVEALQREER